MAAEPLSMTVTISVRRRWFEPAMRRALFCAVWAGIVGLETAARAHVALCWRIEAR